MKRFLHSRVVLCLATILAAPAPVQADPAKNSSPRLVDDLFVPIVEKNDVPGIVAALIEGDKVTALGAAGVRKRGAKQPITIDDKFHIGSCTKAMTATLAAMLVEEGKLKWTTTLEEVFPDRAESMHPDWKAVTIEQLLTHRAGAPAHIETQPIWRRMWSHKGPSNEARILLLEDLFGRPPESPPGTKFAYSNAGYTIAGAVLEKVTGENWEDVIRKRLFEPLDMKSAGFGAPCTKGTLDQPLGHAPGGSPVKPGPAADNPAAIGPAGTVHCSISDWARFITLHLQGERGKARLLRGDTFKKLHTAADGPGDKYAMGWGVDKRDWAGESHLVLRHAGSNSMWLAVVWIAPEENIAMLAMCNQGDKPAHAACDEAVQALLALHKERSSQGKP